MHFGGFWLRGSFSSLILENSWIQQIFATVKTPPTLLKTASFPSRTFANIRQFHHRLQKKKKESVPHISRIFSFIVQISFSSRKCNSQVCPFPQQLARGPVCSICSANPPTRVSCLPSINPFPGDCLFSDLKLWGKDGKVGWTSEQGMALQSAVGSSLQDRNCFFGSTQPCRHCSHP